MTQLHKADETGTAPKTKSKTSDPLHRVRAAVQELHAAITDATAKRGEAIKTDLKAIPQKVKAVMASVKESIGTQQDATKKDLTHAFAYLESTEKHLSESLKSTGHAFETSVRQAVADAHAAAQKVSEAVASQRTATHPHK